MLYIPCVDKVQCHVPPPRPLEYHIEWFHCPKNLLCFAYSPLFPSEPLATTDPFTASIILPFPECHGVGLIQYVCRGWNYSTLWWKDRALGTLPTRPVLTRGHFGWHISNWAEEGSWKCFLFIPSAFALPFRSFHFAVFGYKSLPLRRSIWTFLFICIYIWNNIHLCICMYRYMYT